MSEPEPGPLRVAVDASIQALDEPTGVERAQATWLAALARSGRCELHLLSPAPLPERWRGLPGVQCHDTRGGPVWFWRESVVPRLVRDLGAQVFHSPVAALPLRAGVPLVATVHEAPWAEADDVPGDRSPSHRLRLLLASGLAARIVCPSARTAAQVVALHPDAEARLRVVPHGLDPGLLAHAREPLPRARLAEQLGLADEPFVLGVGRLRHKKAWPVLVEAVARGHAGVPRRLVLAGPPGDASEALAARAAELDGRLHLVGHVSDAQLAGLYVHAAVLAHPSPLEGFGLTPLEALACGTPVVVAEHGHVPEAVGAAALTVRGDAPDDWAAALARALVPDEAAEARRRAAAELVSRRTDTACAEALLALWTELLAATRRR